MSTPFCPGCGSDEVLFSQKKNMFTCESCDTRFEPPAKVNVPLRIFISYGRDEYASLAERLKFDLASRGHEVWFDKEQLKEGGDWEGYIDDGLNWVSKDATTGRVVFIMTPHSVRRPDGYCLNEIAKALGKSIPIIPVMLVFCEPPLSIYRLQYLDMQECYPPDDKQGSYAKQLERLTLALEDKKLDFEGIQSRLLKTLEPISFSADISKLLQDFTGRKWVFDAVDSWLHDPEGSKVFWLTGAPGVGKSAIAAWVRDNRREIGAFHFCDIHSEEKRNPSKLVRSIVYQLSTQLPAFEERLKNLNMESIVQEYREAYTLFDKLIVQPMADNFPPPDRTIVILIDALDEATYQKRNEITLFLTSCAGKTPQWLRFLVTSRPEPEIRAALQSLSPFVLDTTTSENRDDISAYLKKKLPQITDSQTEILLEKSEGVFLYIRHVIAEIEANPPRLSLDRPEQFPQGLGAIYHQLFERQFGNNSDYFDNQIRPLLCLILASYEPLQLGFITKVLGYTNRMELFDRLDRLGSLFPTSGCGDSATIAPFHRSLSDWLCDKDRSGGYYLDIEHGHRLFFDFFTKNYEIGKVEWILKLKDHEISQFGTSIISLKMENDTFEDIFIAYFNTLDFTSNFAMLYKDDPKLRILYRIVAGNRLKMFMENYVREQRKLNSLPDNSCSTKEKRKFLFCWFGPLIAVNIIGDQSLTESMSKEAQDKKLYSLLDYYYSLLQHSSTIHHSNIILNTLTGNDYYV